MEHRNIFLESSYLSLCYFRGASWLLRSKTWQGARTTLKKREEGPVTKLGWDSWPDRIYLPCSLMSLIQTGFPGHPSRFPLWLRWAGVGIALIGFCFASMGTKYAWQKLERYAAHDEGTGTDHKRTLSIHQASHLYCIPPYSGFNPSHLSQLADRALLDWHDRSRNRFTHWL